MLKYSSSVRIVSRRIRDPISQQVHTLHVIKYVPQLEQSSADMKGPWIHEFFFIPVHVHSLGIIKNEICQTRHRVSSHQQSNGGIDDSRQGINLCVVQATMVHGWVCGF